MKKVFSDFLSFIEAYAKTIIIFYLWIILGFIQPNLNFINIDNLSISLLPNYKTTLIVIIGALIYQLPFSILYLLRFILHRVRIFILTFFYAALIVIFDGIDPLYLENYAMISIFAFIIMLLFSYIVIWPILLFFTKKKINGDILFKALIANFFIYLYTNIYIQYLFGFYLFILLDNINVFSFSVSLQINGFFSLTGILSLTTLVFAYPKYFEVSSN